MGMQTFQNFILNIEIIANFESQKVLRTSNQSLEVVYRAWLAIGKVDYPIVVFIWASPLWAKL